MKSTTLDYLWTPVPPWISIGPGEAGRNEWLPTAFYSRADRVTCVRKLRGWKMRTIAQVMDEVGAAFQLFDDFGETWDGLEECLGYLDEWLPADAYIIIVEQAELLLSKDEDGLESFLKTFHLAAQSWAVAVADPDRFVRPPIPFHLLLHLSPEAGERLGKISVIARRAGIPIRLDDQGT